MNSFFNSLFDTCSACTTTPSHVVYMGGVQSKALLVWHDYVRLSSCMGLQQAINTTLAAKLDKRSRWYDLADGEVHLP